MSHKIGKEEEVYYIAHNNSNVFWYDYCPLESTVETGQPYLEMFATKEELKVRVEELGQVWKDPILPPIFSTVEEFARIGFYTLPSGQTITIDDILI